MGHRRLWSTHREDAVEVRVSCIHVPIVYGECLASIKHGHYGLDYAIGKQKQRPLVVVGIVVVIRLVSIGTRRVHHPTLCCLNQNFVLSKVVRLTINQLNSKIPPQNIRKTSDSIVKRSFFLLVSLKHKTLVMIMIFVTQEQAF